MDVIGKRKYYFGIAIFLFILSLIFTFFIKLNLGIDLTGGIQIDYSYKNIDFDKIDKEIVKKSKEIIYDGKEVINNTNIYKVTGKNDLVVVAGFDSSIETKKLEELKIKFKNDVFEIIKAEDSSVIENSYINIGKSFGDYIKNTAIITIIIAILAISIYIAWAFSGFVSGISTFSFGIITVIVLLHDVVIAAGFYIMTSDIFPQFKIDTFFITALLTILGYSINDTIVVFDRIRTNLDLIVKNKLTLKQVINNSVTETLRRSLFTPLTVVLVLIAILIFGPETIKGFTLVMLYGTIVGTYSSIFVASPMLYDMNKNKKITLIQQKAKSSIDDKIVV